MRHGFCCRALQVHCGQCRRGHPAGEKGLLFASLLAYKKKVFIEVVELKRDWKDCTGQLPSQIAPKAASDTMLKDSFVVLERAEKSAL